MMKGLNGYIAVEAIEGEPFGIVTSYSLDLNVDEGSLVFWQPDSVVVRRKVDNTEYILVKEEDLVAFFEPEE